MDQAKDAVSSITDTLSPNNIAEQARTKTGVFVIGAIIGVVILIFTILVLYWIINRTINNRKQFTIPQTKVPVVTSKFQSFEADGIPTPGNGKRMTFAFWIYIHDLNKYQGSYRNVLYRGDMAAPMSTHSPVVLLDSKDNRMHVVFGTEKADPYNGKKADIFGSSPSEDDMKKPETQARELAYLIATRGITIDYIPIQRWVHVTIVVNEEINGGVIQAYLDGELVKIARSDKTEKSVGVMKSGSTTENITSSLNIQNMNLDKRGNLYVGGNMDSPIPGFSGLVSRVSFFNYDLNVRDIYKVYMQGPVDGLASKMGAAYGVRTPIYRVG
jgi:hypothetical protein